MSSVNLIDFAEVANYCPVLVESIGVAKWSNHDAK